MFYFYVARGTDTWWHWALSRVKWSTLRRLNCSQGCVTRLSQGMFSVSFLREETFYPHFPDMILHIVIVRSRDTWDTDIVLWSDQGGAPWGEGRAKIEKGNTRFPLFYNWLPYVQVICHQDQETRTLCYSFEKRGDQKLFLKISFIDLWSKKNRIYSI